MMHSWAVNMYITAWQVKYFLKSLLEIYKNHAFSSTKEQVLECCWLCNNVAV